jgi:hypothetical protein
VQQSSEWRNASSEEWPGGRVQVNALPGFNFGEGVMFHFSADLTITPLGDTN